MAKIILQPDGSSKSDHFEKTVKTFVKLSPILDEIRRKDPSEASRIEEELANIGVDPNTQIAIWGLIPSKKREWDKIEPHKTSVAFYSNKKFHTFGKVIGKIHSPILAKKLWGTDDKGRTWEYIYLIDPKSIKSIDVTLEEVNKVLGKHFQSLQGALVYEDEPLKNLFGIKEVSFIGREVSFQSNKEIREILELLEFQKQIILQGPPGTGKTYLAKKLAEKLTQLEDFCQVVLESLDKYWNEFVQYLDGKTLKTFGGKGREGSEFKLNRRERAKDKLAVIIKDNDSNLSVYKEKVKTILEKSRCNPIEYKSTKEDTDYPYNRVVAQEFIEWLKNKHPELFINAQRESVKLIQFHPSYTYEDLVRGIQVEIKNGSPVYTAVDKIFAQMCRTALKQPEKKFVLIIDEINRANLPSVLGELIYALEYRGEPVETPYEVEGSKTLVVPENLYIIGTMNTADRSVGHIDYAIRRRFAFVNILPDKEKINFEPARKLYEETIEALFKPENLTPEFKDIVEDIKIGHTYFIPKGETVEEKIRSIALKFVSQVIPLLEEYIKDGIVLADKVSELFQNLFGKPLKSVSLNEVINRLKHHLEELQR